MSFETITEQVKAKAAEGSPIGATVKFQIGDDFIYIDGTGESNEVLLEDKDADCLIISSLEDFQKIMDGEINSMMAVMTGKMKIKGDMGVAMKLQSIVG